MRRRWMNTTVLWLIKSRPWKKVRTQVARDKQVQVSKKILTMLLELRNLNGFHKMSEASDQSQLDAQLADASKTSKTSQWSSRKFITTSVSLIGEEGRLRTGKEGCNYVKHILKTWSLQWREAESCMHPALGQVLWYEPEDPDAGDFVAMKKMRCC